MSIVELLARPSEFDGKSVRIEGVLLVGENNHGVCLSKDDVRYWVTANCLALRWDESTRAAIAPEPPAWEGRYVIVEGKFGRSYRGFLGDFFGGLESINRLGLNLVESSGRQPEEPTSPAGGEKARADSK